jgi:predicted phosphodiesterase
VEITSVADDEVVVFDGKRLVTHGGLEPGRRYEFGETEVHTLRSHGELLARVVTVNDVHFGETECGVISGTDIGPTFESAPGEEPYPTLMNRCAVADIGRLDPDAVVVKGDLTSSGLDVEYAEFLEMYGAAFGERLVHVRGNHDSYHGTVFADAPTQERVVEGATLAVLDTARTHQVNGSISADQLEWLDELATRTDTPVLVFGHHHAWDPEHDPRRDDYFGIRPGDSEALFEVFARRPNLVGYFAGHTHRNRRVHIAAAGGAPFVEVACVKDFPGAFAEYRIHEGGLMQVVRRISDPAAIAWTEQTRQMYEGGYGAYAFGRLADRCFALSFDGVTASTAERRAAS